jgi:hypothetical protein
MYRWQVRRLQLTARSWCFVERGSGMRTSFAHSLAAWVVVAASAPTLAQTGNANVDRVLKQVERRAASAPTSNPTAEPARQDSSTRSGVAPSDAGAKRDLDLLGVRLGMPLAEAQTALKKRNPGYEVKILNVDIASPVAMRFPGGFQAQHVRKKRGSRVELGEAVLVFASGPPSAPTVLGVARQEMFMGEEPNADQLVRALTEKYGKPSYNSGGGWRLYWVFGGDFKSCASSADQPGNVGRMLYAPFIGLQGASTVPPASVDQITSYYPALAPEPDAAQARRAASCGRVVRVEIQRTGPNQSLVGSYSIFLVDFASAYNSMASTRLQLAQGQKAKDQAVIQQSQERKKPTF